MDANAEIAHLRRALFTERSLRAAVEADNRALRKANLQREMSAAPHPVSRWWHILCSCVWRGIERMRHIKSLLFDLVNLEDMDEPEKLEPSKKSH
jgi:hypothetical protein